LNLNQINLKTKIRMSISKSYSKREPVKYIFYSQKTGSLDCWHQVIWTHPNNINLTQILSYLLSCLEISNSVSSLEYIVQLT
jgi:hypothetical protein